MNPCKSKGRVRFCEAFPEKSGSGSGEILKEICSQPRTQIISRSFEKIGILKLKMAPPVPYRPRSKIQPRNVIPQKEKKHMTTETKPKPIKAVLGFSRLAPLGLQERINAVLDGLYADPAWVSLNPPIDKATFKAAGDSYASLSTAALDGSRKAIAARKHQGTVVIKMLKQLAHWAEAACNEDMKTFLASGFQAVTTTPTKATPLTESIRKIEPGPNPGQFKVTLKDDPDALAYQLQWAPAVANGATPTWTSQHIGLTRPPTIISGLIPGTSYMFQVRSITKAGAAAWGDPITRICT